MHRLRTKKKVSKEEESANALTPVSTHKSSKRGKNQLVPAKPLIDLEHALPPSNDFRTSLLMPNLAQRFSILQLEQQALAAAEAAAASGKTNGENFAGSEMSGLEDVTGGFSYSPAPFMALGDIAETSSLYGVTIQQSQSDSKYPEEAADGSIMNRGRQGEGNVLFGGRQKVYRVPASSQSLKSGHSSEEFSSSSMGGRAFYDNDMSESNFSNSKLRKEQRETNRASSLPPDEFSGYNNNRNTNSSTNSTNRARTSTAATSITSQGTPSMMKHSASTSSLPSAGSRHSGAMANKPRRPLYEQALDQMQDQQQSSALGKLERFASVRKPDTSSPPLSSSNFGFPQLGSQSYTAPASPVSQKQYPWDSGRESPHSRSISADEEQKELEVELPIDRGLLSPGLTRFNFGLEPRSQTPISPPVSASALEFPTQGPFTPGALMKGPRRSLERSASPAPLARGLSLGSHTHERERKLSNAESAIDPRLSPVMSDSQTFLSTPTSSESGYDYDRRRSFEHPRKDNNALGVVMPLVVASQDSGDVSPVSPISSNSELRKSVSVSSLSFEPLHNPATSPNSPRFSSDFPTPDNDSPTLPLGQGLSLLIRQHLRSDSGHSSMYAGSTYTKMSRNSRYGNGASKVASNISDFEKLSRPSGASNTSSGGNIWEYDDWDDKYYENEDDGPLGPGNVDRPVAGVGKIPPGYRKVSDMMDRSKPEVDEKKEEEEWSRERERVLKKPSDDDDHDKDWEQQLAFRRQLIQQNLRNQEKVNSLHEAQLPESIKELPTKNSGNGAFGILKSKNPGGFLGNGGGSSKPPKIMGMERPSSAGGKGDVKSKITSEMDRRREEEERILRETVRGPKNVPNLQQHPIHRQHPLANYAQQQQQQPQLHPLGSPPVNRSRPLPDLNTNQLHPPPSRQQSQRSPIGLPHPLNSPMHLPRLKPKASNSQLDNGVRSNENTQRGQPMGWKEDKDAWGPHSAPGTKPGTPTSPRGSRLGHQHSMPKVDRFKDDLSRAMMTGQSRAQEEEVRAARREQERQSPDRSLEFDVPLKSTFEIDKTPLSAFSLKTRVNSSVPPPQTVRQRRGTLEAAPLPPLNTNTLMQPPVPNYAISQSSTTNSPGSSFQRTPTTAGTSPSVQSTNNGPPLALVQTIQSSNAGFAPAKKRVVNKLHIGEPKLLSSTSNIPTVNIRPRSPSPPLSAPASAGGPSARRRRMTQTQGIFSGFGKKSSEEVPGMPSMASRRRSGDRRRSGETQDEAATSSFLDEPEKKKRGKLRKSTSDGGALSSRAKHGAMTSSPSMPKLPKGMMASGLVVPPKVDSASGGMI